MGDDFFFDDGLPRHRGPMILTFSGGRVVPLESAPPGNDKEWEPPHRPIPQLGDESNLMKRTSVFRQKGLKEYQKPPRAPESIPKVRKTSGLFKSTKSSQKHHEKVDVEKLKSPSAISPIQSASLLRPTRASHYRFKPQKPPPEVKPTAMPKNSNLTKTTAVLSERFRQEPPPKVVKLAPVPKTSNLFKITTARSPEKPPPKTMMEILMEKSSRSSSKRSQFSGSHHRKSLSTKSPQPEDKEKSDKEKSQSPAEKEVRRTSTGKFGRAGSFSRRTDFMNKIKTQSNKIARAVRKGPKQVAPLDQSAEKESPEKGSSEKGKRRSSTSPGKKRGLLSPKSRVTPMADLGSVHAEQDAALAEDSAQGISDQAEAQAKAPQESPIQHQEGEQLQEDVGKEPGTQERPELAQTGDVENMTEAEYATRAEEAPGEKDGQEQAESPSEETGTAAATEADQMNQVDGSEQQAESTVEEETAGSEQADLLGLEGELQEPTSPREPQEEEEKARLQKSEEIKEAQDGDTMLAGFDDNETEPKVDSEKAHGDDLLVEDTQDTVAEDQKGSEGDDLFSGYEEDQKGSEGDDLFSGYEEAEHADKTADGLESSLSEEASAEQRPEVAPEGLRETEESLLEMKETSAATDEAPEVDIFGDMREPQGQSESDQDPFADISQQVQNEVDPFADLAATGQQVEEKDPFASLGEQAHQDNDVERALPDARLEQEAGREVTDEEAQLEEMLREESVEPEEAAEMQEEEAALEETVQEDGGAEDTEVVVEEETEVAAEQVDEVAVMEETEVAAEEGTEVAEEDTNVDQEAEVVEEKTQVSAEVVEEETQVTAEETEVVEEETEVATEETEVTEEQVVEEETEVAAEEEKKEAAEEEVEEATETEVVEEETEQVEEEAEVVEEETEVVEEDVAVDFTVGNTILAPWENPEGGDLYYKAEVQQPPNEEGNVEVRFIEDDIVMEVPVQKCRPAGADETVSASADETVSASAEEALDSEEQQLALERLVSLDTEGQAEQDELEAQLEAELAELEELERSQDS
eukprot:g70266.t1